jgi:hypothetical protein
VYSAGAEAALVSWLSHTQRERDRGGRATARVGRRGAGRSAAAPPLSPLASTAPRHPRPVRRHSVRVLGWASGQSQIGPRGHASTVGPWPLALEGRPRGKGASARWSVRMSVQASHIQLLDGQVDAHCACAARREAGLSTAAGAGGRGRGASVPPTMVSTTSTTATIITCSCAAQPGVEVGESLWRRPMRAACVP